MLQVYVPKCRYCEMDQQRNRIFCYKLNKLCVTKSLKLKMNLYITEAAIFYILNKYKMFLLVNKSSGMPYISQWIKKGGNKICTKWSLI